MANKRIEKNVGLTDLQNAMDLNIASATDEELSAAERSINEYAPAMMRKLNLIKDRKAALLSQEYSQGTLINYLFPDGASQEALVEEVVTQTVNSGLVKRDAGIEVSITNIDNPKLADCISVRKVLNNKKLLRLYNNGDSSLAPYINEHRHVQTKLFDIVEAEEGGEDNE